MKISPQPCPKESCLTVGRVGAGSTVRFPTLFSKRHQLDDIFIVTAVCNSYVPECVKRCRTYPHKYDKNSPPSDYVYAGQFVSGRIMRGDDFDGFGKAAVTNLRTGGLCYIKLDRICVEVDAEVCVGGDL